MTQLETTRPLSATELGVVFERVIDGGMPASAGPGRTVSSPIASGPGHPLSITAMMGLDDRTFIQAVYAALLNRQPDEPGAQHYAAELAMGRSRIMVLGELRYSEEGRRIGTPVPGLRRRFLLHRLYRIQGLGRIVRVMTGVAALPGLLRNVNQLGRDMGRMEAEILALRSGMAPTEQNIRALSDRAEAAERALQRTQAAVERKQGALNAIEVQLRTLADRFALEPWAAPILALAERSDGQAERIARLEALATMDPAFTRAVAVVGELLAVLRRRFDWPEDGAGLVEGFEAMLREQRNLAVRAISAVERTQAGLHDQERRLSFLLHDMRRLAALGPQASVAVETARDRLLDDLYVAFEDRFRGSRADIKGRQRVYLDLLRQAGAGMPDRRIVDVGSGRGELLELLGEEGLQASGVDLNEAMVALCTEAKLDCTHDDAVAYLARLEPGSLGAVTGFHIIEHLPFAVMVALFDASLRALAPGGVVIFETPNPANLLVASRWFYLDPTHHNPLPGEMVAMIAEARGFVDVSIRSLHPMQTRFEAQDRVLAQQLDDIFHGPQDYALIARKT